jgi:hypothetical protein
MKGSAGVLRFLVIEPAADKSGSYRVRGSHPGEHDEVRRILLAAAHKMESAEAERLRQDRAKAEKKAVRLHEAEEKAEQPALIENHTDAQAGGAGLSVLEPEQVS